MRRRGFLAILALSVTARAQQRGTPVVGFLGLAGNPFIDGFRQGIRDAGYVEGRNIIIDYKPGAQASDLPRLAEDLARRKVDVIAAAGSLAVAAAKRATTTTPIVMTGAGDAIGAGFVASLPQPGGNITGISLLATEASGKRLQLLKDMLPGLARIAIIWNPDEPSAVLALTESHVAAANLGLEAVDFGVRGPDEFEPAFAAAARGGAQAVVLPSAALVSTAPARVAALAARHAMPAIYVSREFPAAGGLMSYGPNFSDLSRRSADYVDKILKGSRPGDLPVEQPTRFQFVINLATAKALGLDIPPFVLAIADEVIE